MTVSGTGRALSPTRDLGSFRYNVCACACRKCRNFAESARNACGFARRRHPRRAAPTGRVVGTDSSEFPVTIRTRPAAAPTPLLWHQLHLLPRRRLGRNKVNGNDTYEVRAGAVLPRQASGHMPDPAPAPLRRCRHRSGASSCRCRSMHRRLPRHTSSRSVLRSACTARPRRRPRSRCADTPG